MTGERNVQQTSTRSLAYNPADQIVSRIRTNDAYAFAGYVNVNRGYEVNGLNQYKTAGPASFTYNADGNLLSDGTNTYTYDVENRLKTVSGDATGTLAYDPLGRLHQISGGPSGVTQYLYDGDELVAEYDTAGAVLRRYVHGAGEDDPLIWYEGSGVGSSNRRRLQADHQGSIVSVADGGGAAILINAYDEYGIPSSNAVDGGTFRYTGQMWLKDLGLYHYKARAYSPTLGRFLQTDPVGYDDQINLYAYVGNDPVNHTDPMGMEAGDVYPTIEAARRDAIQTGLSRGRDPPDRAPFEVGGRIYQWKLLGRLQGYYYDRVIGDSGRVRFPSVSRDASCSFLSSCRTVENYHTHVRDGPGRDSFIGRDVGTANASGLPASIGSVSGVTLRYTPNGVFSGNTINGTVTATYTVTGSRIPVTTVVIGKDVGVAAKIEDDKK